MTGLPSISETGSIVMFLQKTPPEWCIFCPLPGEEALGAALQIAISADAKPVAGGLQGLPEHNQKCLPAASRNPSGV